MCGFAGVLDDPARRVEPNRLRSIAEEMTRTLVHRGPDDSGSWIDADSGLAFGHRRLSIIDLSAEGHQPMVSGSGRYTLAYNGEIYEFEELREELEGRGHAFRGRSDTEVLLAAVEEWGVRAAVERLVGMFAFALWDRKERRLHLVRDRLGKKPLYYGWAGGSFVFASELKAIRAHPDFVAEIDRGALTLYLRFGYVPAPFSIYRGIHKLPQGSLLSLRPDELQPGTELSALPERYWSAAAVAEAAVDNPFRGNDDEVVEQLDALLRQAVRSRMVADVPLGVFLSGGIDSSTVTGMMQAQSGTPVRSFTIGFLERGGEQRHAKKVAAHLGTLHTEFVVEHDDVLAAIPRMPAIYDEPFSDSSQLPTYLVSRLAREHVTVALSGDGGDELFCGYRRYFRGEKIWTHLARTPKPVRRALAAIVGAGARFGTREGRMGGLVADLRANSLDEMFRNRVSRWNDPLAVVRGGSEPLTQFDTVAEASGVHDPSQRMMLLDLVTYLTDDILVKVDRASMAVSLETRNPLLDHRVVEFALRLPLSMKLRDGAGKWALRQVLARYVPPRLTDRPKSGFGAPVRAWITGPLREWAEAQLSRERLAREGYLDADVVRGLWKACLSGQREIHQHVWDVLMFQAWLEAVDA